jgi:hypothetical protein
MRSVLLTITVAVASLTTVPIAPGSGETAPRDSLAVLQAKAIQHEVTSRYASARGGLAVAEASSTSVVESFTLLSPGLTETHVVPAHNGIYFAICPVGATCPYPARGLARSAAKLLPRRLALELAVRAFRETSVDVVAVSLPTPRFVLFVIERADLAKDDLSTLAEALSRDPGGSPSGALRELVERVTRPRVFTVIGLEPTASGRDSLAAVPVWLDLGR